MNYVIDHKRYPHWCRVYTRKGEDSFDDGEVVIIYEGECVKYGSSQMRKYVNGNVIKCDYAVDIPYELIGVRPGCLIDVRDKNQFLKGIEVVTPFTDDVSHLGTTVFFNAPLN